MLTKIGKYFLFLSIASIAFSCTKDIPPEMQANNKKKMVENSKMPDDSIHRKFMTDPHQSMNSETGKEKTKSNEEELGDETANKISKEADESDALYRKSKSESDKKKCINKQLEAANYLMLEADLPPREKYKPALQRYKRVLELDPGNKEAIANKEQIEEIYTMLGKPIPN